MTQRTKLIYLNIKLKLFNVLLDNNKHFLVQNLSESLSRRSGELVGELTAAAAPLAASSEPAVAASLRRDLDDAAAAYEHTCTNLNQLCDK